MKTKFLLVVYDTVLINGIFLLSFLVRYGLPLPKQNFGVYKENFAFLAFMYMLAFALAGVFQHRFRSYWNLFQHVFKGMFLGTLFGLALVYVFRERWFSFPSSVFLLAFPTGTALFFFANAFLLRLLGKIRKKVLITYQYCYR